MECKVSIRGGKVIDLLNMTEDDIELEDIAYGLAHNCRWAGQTFRFFSVAEHSLLVSSLMDGVPNRLIGLFHDAEEAYWGDITRPMKQILADRVPELTEAMTRTRQVIFSKFGIPYVMEGVKLADQKVLDYEYDYYVNVTSEADVFIPVYDDPAEEWLAAAIELLEMNKLLS